MTGTTGQVKAFFDTEILLSGLLCSQAPFNAIFDRRLQYDLAISDKVFQEVLDILRRSQSLKETLPSTAEVSLPDIFNSFEVEISRIPPSMTIEFCQDPGNDKFLAGAVYLYCDYLVTAVPDLLAFEESPNWQQFRTSNGLTTRIVDAETFVTERVRVVGL